MTLFRGSGVAIVTPFNDKGQIDYEVMSELVEFQISGGTDAIVVAGTTGEASTLTDQEQLDLIDFVVKAVAGRVCVIAGTGSNDTHHGIVLSQKAEALGVDGLLHVTPYYNKTSQRGLYEHFKAIAEGVSIPVILYNVPSRTQVNLLPETVHQLSKISNIVGLKDATGNLSQTISTASLCGPDFAIYSGNDDVVIPVMSVGGAGVISVLANIAPQATHDMVAAYLDGDLDHAIRIQLDYKALIDAIFVEPNPIPVKKALALMGYGSMILRLPLYEAETATTELLKPLLAKAGLI